MVKYLVVKVVIVREFQQQVSKDGMVIPALRTSMIQLARTLYTRIANCLTREIILTK